MWGAFFFQTGALVYFFHDYVGNNELTAVVAGICGLSLIASLGVMGHILAHPETNISRRYVGALIDIVLMGSVNCTLAFGKHWIAKGEKDKAVLNITTTYAWTGSGYVVPSACAKAGRLCSGVGA